MQTIVFHSYKGGVGRTLALANLGYALSRMGKKVVLLDLDVDAPSLHTKFAPAGRINGGYIDYLKQYYEPIEDKNRTTTVVYEVMEASIRERSYSLQKYTIDVNRNLKLIPAGDPSQPIYWWNLGSTWLHFLLSLTSEEINKVENGFPIYNTVSRKFLQKELEVIASLFRNGGADFLIVDCRSPREYSSAALIFWAGIVVSMFNASSDGLKGFANVHRFVQRGRFERSVPGTITRPRIIPVLCRVPEDFPEDDAKTLYNTMLAHWREIQDPFGPKLEVPEQFAILHEFRDLEQAERLLLHRSSLPRPTSSGVRDVEALLSHDYVALFRHIFANEDDAARGMPLREAKIWRRVLGLGDTVTRERFFPIRESGIMLNANERNVAFRAKSVLNWLTSFKESKIADLKLHNVRTREVRRAVNETFDKVGYNWGADFGQRFMHSKRASASKDNVPDLLAAWCKFDYHAGFGMMDYSYNPAGNSGRITWKRSFLGESGRQSHLTHFACGYIRGVLENLLSNPKGNVRVKPETATIFAFSMISRRQSSIRKSNRKRTKWRSKS